MKNVDAILSQSFGFPLSLWLQLYSVGCGCLRNREYAEPQGTVKFLWRGIRAVAIFIGNGGLLQVERDGL